MDHWYAECLPCKWEEAHGTQDLALSAAEQHVLDEHRDLFDIAGDVRGRKMSEQKMGHVQYRSEGGAGFGITAETFAPLDAAVELTTEQKIAVHEQILGSTLDALALLKQKQLADTKAGE